ncbi:MULTISPECIES: hypothetical protein [Rahnella]|uniref:hypothetical protein n=1 Tax=Rahnella TaxID=34037 RepID=UPI003D2A3FF0
MEFDITTFFKAILGGAGAGYAFTGGISLALPELIVTDRLLLSMAAIGAVLLPLLYLKSIWRK